MIESEHRIVSAALGNARTLWVERPAAATPVRAWLVVLDGEFYRAGVGARATLGALRAEGRLAATAVVYVSNVDLPTRSRECPCHDPFAVFLAEELAAWWAATFPTDGVPRHRVLVGLSYTGLAAAFVALRYPLLFDRVIAQSGSFWWNEAWLADAYAHAPEPSATQFWLEVGQRETATNVAHANGAFQRLSQIEGVGRFRDELARRGQACRYTTFDGGHDFRAWAKTLPQALRWAGDVLP